MIPIALKLHWVGARLALVVLAMGSGFLEATLFIRQAAPADSVVHGRCAWHSLHSPGLIQQLGDCRWIERSSGGAAQRVTITLEQQLSIVLLEIERVKPGGWRELSADRAMSQLIDEADPTRVRICFVGEGSDQQFCFLEGR